MTCSDRDWHGCYSGNYDLWCSEAYSHPAKMSPSLCFRILEHLEELGLLNKDSVVLDMMAGIGTTGLCWATKGGRSIMVELEPKFISLIEQNKAHLEKRLGHAVDMTILQGDSRHLSDLLTERGLVDISSPPYQNNADLGGGIDWEKANRPDRLQIGQERSESYLDAMRLCYAEVARVADVLVVVVKDPTRNKAIRPLGRLTMRLLRQTGWRLHCYHRAILFEEQERGRLFEETEAFGIDWQHAILCSDDKWGNWPGLGYNRVHLDTEAEYIEGKLSFYGIENATDLQADTLEEIKQEYAEMVAEIGLEPGQDYWCRQAPTGETLEIIGRIVNGRLSFFKRLSWQKGSPVANYEHVLICVRDGVKGVVNISSPPYSNLRESPGDLTQDTYDIEKKHEQGKGAFRGRYGDTPGQIGKLK